MVKICLACGGVSVAFLGWMALTLYTMNGTIQSLSTRVADQNANVSQRVDRLQQAIDQNAIDIKTLEVQHSEQPNNR